MESPLTWPTSACSSASTWSAAETEAGDVHVRWAGGERVGADQDSLASRVWAKEEAPAPTTVREPILGSAHQVREVADFCSIWDTGDHEDDDMAEVEEDDPEDSFRGMYGMMSAAPCELEEDEEGLGSVSSDVDVDEAQWLRRTYETVYNPVARQRALNALVSGINAKRQEGGESMEHLVSFSAPTQAARKCTVMYDFV